MTQAITLSPTAEHLARAGRHLALGGLVGMPTETVYGLAGSIYREEALAQIFAVKERPTFDPLIVHVSPAMVSCPGALEKLEKLGLVDGTRLPGWAKAHFEELLSRFWPGPLTVVLPKGSRVPDLATSGLGTVGLRMPGHPVAQALIDAAGAPLAAPSANRFGRISPTQASHVIAELGDRIEMVVDGGACAVGVESTVLTLALESGPVVLRPGSIGSDELSTVLEREVHAATKAYAETKAEASGLAAPGMLESHYAPSARVLLLEKPLGGLSNSQIDQILSPLASAGHGIGPLTYSAAPEPQARRISGLLGRDVVALRLSPDGRLETAARNLFATLRALDATGVQVILAEPLPSPAAGSGLGYAIADRLKRAAAPRLPAPKSPA